MLEIKQQIIEKIEEVLKELGVEDENISLEIPEDLAHGDFTTNVAMRVVKNDKGLMIKDKKETPFEFAKKLIERLNHSSFIINHCSRVEAVPPGFVNFYLSKEYLLKNLENPTKNNATLAGKTILVEFTDPNPFKEFHIGHLYSNTVGEAISRLLEAQGADVKRLCYQGDVGMHVAKAVYGIKNQLTRLLTPERSDGGQGIEDMDNKSLEERIKFLGQAYALGAKAYEENEAAKEEIIEINKKIYDKSDFEINEIYDKGKAWSLEYFENIYQGLGMKSSENNAGKVFDKYYFESEVADLGIKTVQDNKEIFEKSEGAVIFPGKKYGLHDRVFINSLGLPTYEAKELGLAFTKDQDFSQYEKSIVITGNEINEYFKVLLKAISLIKPEIAIKTKHLSHGMVRLPTGKMASRKGDVITGESLLQMVYEKIKETYSDMPLDSVPAIGIGAIKYALLKSGIGHDIVFSFDESINLNGNSGPYIQYAYVRTQSILSKVKNENHELPARNASISVAGGRIHSSDIELNKEESDLLRIINQYEELLRIASENFAPNMLCNYLYNLAKAFNFFYQKHRILDTKDMQQKQLRIELTKGVGTVIKNGLAILGIETPEQM